MVEILQWTTLIVCAAAALFRIPSALHGRNRSLFLIFLLATAAAVLSLEPFYLAIDGAVGGINVAHLLLRLIVFATVYLVALLVCKAFGAAGAQRLISGPAGLAVLGIFTAALVTIFVLMEPASSSAGLAGTADTSARNATLLPFYWAIARGYPVYVVVALLPALIRSVNSRLPALVRVGAGFMAGGAAATAAGFLLEFTGPVPGVLRAAVNNAAVVFFVLGLGLVWLARVRAIGSRSLGKRPGTSFTER